jgi:hypothetical protein
MTESKILLYPSFSKLRTGSFSKWETGKGIFWIPTFVGMVQGERETSLEREKSMRGAMVRQAHHERKDSLRMTRICYFLR